MQRCLLQGADHHTSWRGGLSTTLFPGEQENCILCYFNMLYCTLSNAHFKIHSAHCRWISYWTCWPGREWRQSPTAATTTSRSCHSSKLKSTGFWPLLQSTAVLWPAGHCSLMAAGLQGTWLTGDCRSCSTAVTAPVSSVPPVWRKRGLGEMKGLDHTPGQELGREKRKEKRRERQEQEQEQEQE